MSNPSLLRNRFELSLDRLRKKVGEVDWGTFRPTKYDASELADAEDYFNRSASMLYIKMVQEKP